VQDGSQRRPGREQGLEVRYLCHSVHTFSSISPSDFQCIFRDSNCIPIVLITNLDHGAQISEMEKREPKGMRTVS